VTSRLTVTDGADAGDNQGDVDIVYVCEGSQHNIVLRDISIWNCQNPNVRRR
jgi:hypothetical protein